MKKTVTAIAAGALFLSLGACHKKDDETVTTEATEEATDVATAVSTDVSTEASTDTPTDSAS